MSFPEQLIAGRRRRSLQRSAIGHCGFLLMLTIPRHAHHRYTPQSRIALLTGRCQEAARHTLDMDTAAAICRALASPNTTLFAAMLPAISEYQNLTLNIFTHTPPVMPSRHTASNIGAICGHHTRYYLLYKSAPFIQLFNEKA